MDNQLSEILATSKFEINSDFVFDLELSKIKSGKLTRYTIDKAKCTTKAIFEVLNAQAKYSDFNKLIVLGSLPESEAKKFKATFDIITDLSGKQVLVKALLQERLIKLEKVVKESTARIEYIKTSILADVTELHSTSKLTYIQALFNHYIDEFYLEFKLSQMKIRDKKAEKQAKLAQMKNSEDVEMDPQAKKIAIMQKQINKLLAQNQNKPKNGKGGSAKTAVVPVKYQSKAASAKEKEMLKKTGKLGNIGTKRK